MHEGQLRKSGEPYLIHPVEVAKILAGLGMDEQTIIAGLLHDVVEDTEYTEEQLKQDFGEEVTLLVDGVTKLGNLIFETKEDAQAENLSLIHILKRYAEGEYISMKEFRKLDIAFHKAVIEGCENQIISRSLPMFLATCTEWYSVWTSLDFGKVLESFRRYHRKILEAVESHDADSAYRYAAEHTQEIIDIYESSGKKSRKSE